MFSQIFLETSGNIVSLDKAMFSHDEYGHSLKKIKKRNKYNQFSDIFSWRGNNNFYECFDSANDSVQSALSAFVRESLHNSWGAKSTLSNYLSFFILTFFFMVDLFTRSSHCLNLNPRTCECWSFLSSKPSC